MVERPDHGGRRVGSGTETTGNVGMVKESEGVGGGPRGFKDDKVYGPKGSEIGGRSGLRITRGRVRLLTRQLDGTGGESPRLRGLDPRRSEDIDQGHRGRPAQRTVTRGRPPSATPRGPVSTHTFVFQAPPVSDLVPILGRKPETELEHGNPEKVEDHLGYL